MSFESILIFLGLLVILSPFLGLPLAYLSWILPVLGILILLISVRLRAKRSQRSPQTHPPFHEPETPPVT